MKSPWTAFITVCVFSLLLIGSVHAEVDWEVFRTIQLEGNPLDVSVTPSGKRIYVLTDQGRLLVYSVAGQLMGEMEVGPDVEGISTLRRDDIVFLRNRKGKSIQIVTVDLIQDIHVSGSPSMGAQKAPVVVAVFSDFE